MAPPDLLQVLAALVEADRGPAGFTGRVAVGVRTSPRWYLFEAATGTGRMVEEVPDADAWLGLGTAEAEAVLGRGPVPARPSVAVAGDEALIDRFLTRYLRSISLLEIRGGAE